MQIKISVNFSLFALSVLAALSAAQNYEPLYLYEESSQQTHLETEYTALDQCTRWGTAQLRHHSYALRFELTGKCEKGILICYPGSLDSSEANSAYGMRAEIQFQVQNLKDSEVAGKCLEYQKKCDKTNDANYCNARRVWHGVRVSVPKAFGGPLIELSISKKKYNFSGTKSFSIEFGSPKNLITKVTDEMGREIRFSHDEEIHKAYLSKKIGQDAKLLNYTGLWMLGLDFLPMNNQDRVQMHVYRDCGCEMHAWFVHPSDEVPSLRLAHPVVSEDCPMSVRETESQRFALPEPAAEGRAIRTRQRLNRNSGGNIELRFGNAAQRELLVLRVDNPPYGAINISSAEANSGRQQYIGTGEEAVEDQEELIQKQIMNRNAMVSRQFKTFGSVDSKGQWEDKYLDIELTVHKYFYEVKVGDRKSVAYFPKSPDWWTEDQLGNFTHIEIAGDVYPSSIDEPQVKERHWPGGASEHSEINPNRRMAHGDGTQFAFDGRVRNVMQPNWSDEHWQTHRIGQQPTFEEQEKFHFEAPPKLELFKPNEPFEMRIRMVHSDNEDVSMLNISVSTPKGTNRTSFGLMSMTFRDIKFINVVGTVQLFEAPFVVPPENYTTRKPINEFPIFPLLVAGDSIGLEGQLNDADSFLTIELLHDSPLSNPYFGNVVLQVNFKIDDGKMFLTTFTSRQLLTDHVIKTFPSKIFPGEQFAIEIRVEFEEYKIFVYGALAATYEHVLPPWAVSYINFRGSLYKISNFVFNRTRGIFCDPKFRSLAVPLVAEIPEQRMLQAGDSITINGTVTKQNAQIVILLLNEALESYDTVPPSVNEHLLNGTSTMVGTIVTRAIFSTKLDGKGFVKFSYNNLTEEHQLDSALSNAQNFHLKIIMRKRPVFRLDGFGRFALKRDTMPVWAIQYIRIDGDLKLYELPRIEFRANKRWHVD